jgi:hypothetical protein
MLISIAMFIFPNNRRDCPRGNCLAGTISFHWAPRPGALLGRGHVTVQCSAVQCTLGEGRYNQIIQPSRQGKLHLGRQNVANQDVNKHHIT